MRSPRLASQRLGIRGMNLNQLYLPRSFTISEKTFAAAGVDIIDIKFLASYLADSLAAASAIFW